MDQNQMPLYQALINNMNRDSISFHVPGHKYGRVFPSCLKGRFQSTLQLDATEIGDLDDLHAAEGVIREAQQLASQSFGSKETFFLVNGTTVGNLVMILSVCRPGEKIIVQRNCHKSVLNGLELAGASPVFISPVYEEETKRYSKVTFESVARALEKHPDSKAVFLTYPDYFGRTYPLDEMVEHVHRYGIPLLIDEAHGVHFHLGDDFPQPALAAGVDAVVQSAHKMAPAMTMASFLHLQGERVDVAKVRHYLQMLQSSSPSYPLMASLDVSRAFLANWTKEKNDQLFSFIKETRDMFGSFDGLWHLLPSGACDDPLKLTLEVKGRSGFEVARALEEAHLVPELATSRQVLLILGLHPSFDTAGLRERLSSVDCKLKKSGNHATIIEDQLSFPDIQTLEISYSLMQGKASEQVNWSKAIGHVSAEAVIPYPPGIPLLMKGERISHIHRERVRSLWEQGARFQNADIERGIRVFKGELL